MKRWTLRLDIRFDRNQLIANKTRSCWIIFDPTNEPTPPHVAADRLWVWTAILLTGSVVGLVIKPVRPASYVRRQGE